MLFSANEVINFKETGISITDRFIVIPFNATFTDSEGNRDINICEKLCTKEALQIIATRAIFEFCNVLENGKFTIPDIVQEETDRYFVECNNALQFCKLLPINTFVTKSSYYKEYRKWCNENQNKILSHSQFGKQLKALGYRSERYSIKGERNTYYTNPDFDNDTRHSIYRTFTADRDEKKINNISFEKYLCQRLYWEKIEQDMQTNEDEGVVELEPSIPEEEMFDFTKPFPNEEETFNYLTNNELDI